MELNGALSNPFVTDKDLLIRLTELRRQLVENALESPRHPQEARTKRTPVLEVVTRALEGAARPLRAKEIHALATSICGEPLCWSSVKGILSAYTLGGDRRFRRVRRGVYELNDAGQGGSRDPRQGRR